MKHLLLMTMLFASGGAAFAQQDSTSTVPADSLPRKKNTLTLAAVYANNASYYGQRAEETTPYAALAATYQFKSGFYLTGLAYTLLNETPAEISAANLGAGISWKFNKKLSGDLRYTHSFYPKLSPLIQAVNTENISAGLKHNNWLEVTVSGDYNFGKTNDVFVTGGLAKDIDLFSVTKKDVISVKPFMSVVGGTQRYYQTYAAEQKLRDSLLGTITGPIFGTPTTPGDTRTVSTTNFDLLSYNLELPLSYNRGHYIVEAAYQLSVLSQKAQLSPGKTNSFFTFSFYYQF